MQKPGAGADSGGGVARGPTGAAASRVATDPAVRWAKQREAWRRPTASRARRRQARCVARGAEPSAVGCGAESRRRAGSMTPPRLALRRSRTRPVDHDSIVETVLFSQFYPEFPSPVPLPQLVEVLSDLWSADGLPPQQL